MADSKHSSSDDSNMDSTEEESSDGSKLKFSEDEEILIVRMYNLIGEREDPGQNSRGNREILELEMFHQRGKKAQYLIGEGHDIITVDPVDPFLRQKGREGK